MNTVNRNAETSRKATIIKAVILGIFMLILLTAFTSVAQAAPAEGQPVATAGEAQDNTAAKAIAAAIAIGLGTGAGAIAMGSSISKASESISRQPEAAGQIRTNLLLGLVFLETAIIYALVVAIMIIFVL